MWKSIAISLLVAAVAHAAEWQKIEVEEPHMGTIFRILVYTRHEQTARVAIAKAYTRVAELDQKLSDYKVDSELNRLCRVGFQHPTQVSAELFYVLDVAQKIAEQSNGAFDISVGPLVRLWRQARQTKQLPSAEIVATSRAQTGFENIRLDRRHRLVTLLKPHMQIDLGGIAKGYTADQAFDVLKRAGLSKSLVAASGDIRVGDAPPGRRAWRVALDPFGKGSVENIELVNQAVSTSGATEQRIEIDGKRYSHILDPRSGLGLKTSHAVSAVARKGILADAWATAFCVLGPEAGRPFMARMPKIRIFFFDPGLANSASTAAKSKN